MGELLEQVRERSGRPDVEHLALGGARLFLQATPRAVYNEGDRYMWLNLTTTFKMQGSRLGLEIEVETSGTSCSVSLF